MSRSGYSDDCDGWDLIRWRGAVNSAIKGARGQAFLRELAAAMDAMPEKRLIAHDLTAEGQFCALGVVCSARGVPIDARLEYEPEHLSKMLGIARAMAAEIMFENDDRVDDYLWVEVEICGPMRRPDQHVRWARKPVEQIEERRWHSVRQWVAEHITEEPKP